MSLLTEPHLLNSSRWRNLRVGILGGSFNPPHQGHVHISKLALNTLKLDAIWWLVTPQNPLKSAQGLPNVSERADMCRVLIDHPKILVTEMEQEFDSTYSYASVRQIKKHFPHTDFVWITGMDNAHTMHEWQFWKKLLAEICVVHITRHPPVKLIKQCPVRMLASQRHIILDRGGRLPLDSHTTYWLLQKKMMNISSTEIRNKKRLESA